jgi:hypothetical protein
MVVSRTVRDDLGDVGPAIAWAGEFADQAGLAADARFAVDLSLEEALANLIMHGQADSGRQAYRGFRRQRRRDHHHHFRSLRAVRCHGSSRDRGCRAYGRGPWAASAAILRPHLDYAASGDGNLLTMRFPAERAMARTPG